MNQYAEYLSTQKAFRQEILNRIQDLTVRKQASEVRQEVLQKSLDLVNAVTMATLNEIRTFIEDTVSLCLSTVYGAEYKFSVDYDVKRGRSEAQVSVVRGHEKLDPRDEVGGGVIDVASLGFRLVLWLLQVPRSSPVFILDEPFRFVSRDLTEKVADMLQKICEVFDAQVIMVSHNEDLVEACDKTVFVYQENEVSHVEEVK